tara:strand:- start:271 stop:780 length:510 start_codon:yes stop_codon:yes gene_type:complete
MGFTPSMKNLIRIISLTLAVFLGSVGTSWGADFNKGVAAVQSGDFATALREWTPLAKQGDADAQFSLGVMYEKGEGVAKDNKAAVKWYTLAAEQGLADAQFNLGVMYANGTGVIKDNVYAHLWWNIAASSGDEDASENRDIIAEQMTLVQLKKAKNLAHECVRKKFKGC